MSIIIIFSMDFVICYSGDKDFDGFPKRRTRLDLLLLLHIYLFFLLLLRRSARPRRRSAWTGKRSWGAWRLRLQPTDRTQSLGTRTAGWWRAGRRGTSWGSCRSAEPIAARISVWCAGVMGRQRRARPPYVWAVSKPIYRIFFAFSSWLLLQRKTHTHTT